MALLKLLIQLRGGVNQLYVSLNNLKSVKTLLIFHHVVINNIQHMDSKGKEQQSHIKYTQRQIFHEETHKGRKPLLLRNDRQSFKFCTSSIIEHQLNVRLLPLFYKLQLI
jgi:ribonuclease HIII